jgi:electron transfer flavoprotein alpha subunit
MAQGFLVYVETRNGKARKGSLEALSAARRLANDLNCQVSAVVIGDDCQQDVIRETGPDRLFAVSYADGVESRDAWIGTLHGLVQELEPEFVLASATSRGKDLLPGVAARFDSSVVQDITDAEISEGTLLFKRPIFAGKAFETVKCSRSTAFVTLRPNVFPLGAVDGASCETVQRVENVSAEELRTVITDLVESSGGKVELTEAAIIVSGGRGIKEQENYRLIEELAEALGAAAGASRAIVDSGWVDHQQQVGQTGKTVSPNLYIAVGISGAIQHMAGMSSSKYIVAINKDEDAPIFKVANYGIVGDLFKIVPLLTEEVKKSSQL